MKLYSAIVQNAMLPEQFREAKENRIARISALLPNGSGFDSGTKIKIVSDKKIVFTTAFHHVNENGFYDGWTEHTVIVKPDFVTDINITVSGRDKNMIKDYINEIFNHILMSDFDWVQKCEK